MPTGTGADMIPIGYMAKFVASKPDWLKASHVDEILSVSPCVSKDFADWVDDWKHNGHWFFDSPEAIGVIAAERDVDLSSVRWFYYEAHEDEFDEESGEWQAFAPDRSFTTSIASPPERHLKGYDIVTFSCGSSAECSPLSCNHLAERIAVNRHCLLGSYEEAAAVLQSVAELGAEPGPYRIFAVYEIPAPELG